MSYLIKLRHQVNDVFSEFRKYIAPTYYHDRCERSLHMHLYVMHKREILLALAGFLSTFILLLFIGLAGPNVTKLDKIRASGIFANRNINDSIASSLLSQGPFVISTPAMSTYSSHICLWITFFLKNAEVSEAFNKDFFISLTIRGKMDENDDNVKSGILILNEDFQKSTGRLHHLSCSGKQCDPIQALHLEYLEYPSYQVEVRFQELDSVNDKYTISDIEFTFQSMNTSFTTLCIWFRLIFLAVAFGITCWFTHSLHRYQLTDWAMEQKWTAALLTLLIFCDDPFYPMNYLLESKMPRILQILFETTFYSCLLLFWLTFFHGIRQNNRKFAKFYLPKLLIVGTLWFIIIYASSWSNVQKMENPTLDEEATFAASDIMRLFDFMFYFCFALYFLYLAVLLITAFTELRSMPYFDLRLKLQSFLLVFTLMISVLVVVLSGPSSPASSMVEQNDVTEIRFLRMLPWTYQSSSSASFLSVFSIINLYVCICAYFYFPSTASLIDSRIVRDNPTLSMINDSDEDVIYGSDTEQPLNQAKLIDPKNDEEESD